MYLRWTSRGVGRERTVRKGKYSPPTRLTGVQRRAVGSQAVECFHDLLQRGAPPLLVSICQAKEGRGSGTADGIQHTTPMGGQGVTAPGQLSPRGPVPALSGTAGIFWRNPATRGFETCIGALGTCSFILLSLSSGHLEVQGPKDDGALTCSIRQPSGC